MWHACNEEIENLKMIKVNYERQLFEITLKRAFKNKTPLPKVLFQTLFDYIYDEYVFLSIIRL